MKKALSLMLALVLVLGLSVPAMAAQTGSNITITSAKPKETYRLYKLFDLSLNAEKGAFTYTLPADSPWKEFFTDNETGAKWFTYNETSGVIAAKNILTGDNNDPEVQKFVLAALDYLDSKNYNLGEADEIKGIDWIGEETCGENDNSVTFENLDLGYYLIDTTVGTFVIVETNNTLIEIGDKNSTPTLDKMVQEDSPQPGSNGWGDDNTADIGQTVNYQVIVENVQRLHKVDLRDKMSAGLTFDPTSVKVYLNEVKNETLVERETNPGVIGSGGTWYLVDANNYSPDFGAQHLGSDTFHIHFRDTFIDPLKSSDKIIVTYSATLNENAVIGNHPDDEDLTNDGNPNEAWLAYGDNTELHHDIVKTYTWEVPVLKYTRSATEASVPLAGAKFILERVDAEQVAVDEVLTTREYAVIENGKFVKWTNNSHDANVDAAEKATVLVTDDKGEISVSGLDSDYYHLIEIEAPVGYNKLTSPVQFSIANDGALYMGTSKVDYVGVLNQSGAELPATGGVGTTLFYIIGGAMAVGAAVLLVTKKRMSSEG